jgi:hypothetical protein
MSSRKLLGTMLVFLLIIGLVSAAHPVRAASQLVVTYGQPAGTISAGQTFSIPVNLSVPVDKPFTGGQFNLSWNPAVLSLVSVTNGTYFSTATCPSVPTMFFQPPIINNRNRSFYQSCLGSHPLRSQWSGIPNFGLFIPWFYAVCG